MTPRGLRDELARIVEACEALSASGPCQGPRGRELAEALARDVSHPVWRLWNEVDNHVRGIKPTAASTVGRGEARAKGPGFVRVLQAEGSRDCVACACAMIASTTAAEAHAWMGTAAGEEWHDAQAAAFLMSKGVFMGSGCAIEPATVHAGQVFSSEASLDGRAMYLAVESGRPGGHAVYWDGRAVWDPHPWAEDAAPLSGYRVTDFWPLYDVNDEVALVLSRLRMGPKP